MRSTRCALRAELGVKHDIQRPQFGEALVQRLALVRKVRQRRLVGLPEIERVGQAGAHHAAIAGGDGLAAVAGDDIRNQQEFIGQPARFRVAQHKTFLVGADRGADHLVGNVQKTLVEFAHQHDRPFDQAGDLVQQALVLDQFQPLSESEVARVVQDDVAPPRRVKHHFRGLKPKQIIVEAPHFERLRRHEAMAVSDIAGRNPADFEGHDFRLFGFRPEGGDDRMKRAHPAQGGGLGRTRAPAHRLGPGEIFYDLGQDLGKNVERRRALAFDHGEIELAALFVGFDPGLVQRGQPRALQKALDRGVGRADARALFLLALVGLAGGEADDMEREPARGDETFRRFKGQAAFDQGAGDEFFQVGGGLGLHPRRDFLGEKFEQKVGHDGLLQEREGRA